MAAVAAGLNRYPDREFTALREGLAAYLSRGDTPVAAEQVWAAIAHLPPHRGAAVAFVIATACDFSNIETARSRFTTKVSAYAYSVLFRRLGV